MVARQTDTGRRTVAHRIRLQGPWQVLPPVSEEPRGDSACESLSREMQTVKLPASWVELFGHVAGKSLFRRQFNRPSNLTSDDRVQIRLPGECGRVLSCQLNGQEIKEVPNEPLVFDVTTHLQEFNRIELQIEFIPGSSPGSGGLWQPVLLEILSEDRC